jgi:hypothetical protein
MIINNPVKQRDNTGCGIACVAHLVRLSYCGVRKTATSKLENFPQMQIQKDCTTNYCTTHQHLQKLLASYGLQTKRLRKVDSWKQIKTTSIVGINKKKSGNWHWVVYYPEDGTVVDPRSTGNNVRTDLGRMRPWCCISLKEEWKMYNLPHHKMKTSFRGLSNEARVVLTKVVNSRYTKAGVGYCIKRLLWYRFYIRELYEKGWLYRRTPTRKELKKCGLFLASSYGEALSDYHLYYLTDAAKSLISFYML